MFTIPFRTAVSVILPWQLSPVLFPRVAHRASIQQILCGRRSGLQRLDGVS